MPFVVRISLATVLINVAAPPTAGDDGYGTDEDVTLIVPAGTGVLFNDSANIPVDGVTAALLTNPTKGTLSVFNADGSFTYVPNPDSNGLDSFTYQANDGEHADGATERQGTDVAHEDLCRIRGGTK